MDLHYEWPIDTFPKGRICFRK